MSDSLTPELCELFAAVREPEAEGAAARLAELEERLTADASLRRQYAQYMLVCACLQFECSAAAPAGAVAGADAALVHEAAETRNTAAASGEMNIGLRQRVVRYALAAAMVLAVGLTITAMVSVSMNEQRAHRAGSIAVATLIDAHEAVFGTSDVPTEIGSQLANGFLRLQSGTATLRFRSGATVTIEGPVEFGINSEMRGFLQSGKLLAHVPPSAHGFTIGAPGMSVIDLGTEFGMVVGKPGGTQVHVLTGRVTIMTDGDSRQMQVGNACAVTEAGAIHDIRVEPKLFAREAAAIPVDGSLLIHSVARQSSIYAADRFNYVAQNAIDGDPATFTHTDIADQHPWFQIDLERESFVKHIVLHNRTQMCAARLRDITVEVLDASGQVVYTSPLLNPHNELGAGADYPKDNARQVVTLDVSPNVMGTAVRVRRTPDRRADIDDRSTLSLSEIEVIGHVISPVEVPVSE